MKRKANFYKVCDAFAQLEKELGTAVFLDDLFINIDVNELERLIRVIAKKKGIDVDLD